MKRKFANEIRVPVNRGHYAWYLIGPLVLVPFLVFGWSQCLQTQDESLFSFAVLGFMSLIGILFTTGVIRYLFFPDSYDLIIGQRGITEQLLVQRRVIPWSEIVSVEVCDIDGKSSVGFRVKKRKWVSWFTFGRVDEVLHNEYHQPPKVLVVTIREAWAHFDPKSARQCE